MLALNWQGFALRLLHRKVHFGETAVNQYIGRNWKSSIADLRTQSRSELIFLSNALLKVCEIHKANQIRRS